jgi:hypothetical protein
MAKLKLYGGFMSTFIARLPYLILLHVSIRECNRALLKHEGGNQILNSINFRREKSSQCKMHNDFASDPDRDHDFLQLSSTKRGFVIAVKSRQLGGIKMMCGFQ